MAALRVVSWNVRAAIGTGPFPDRWWTRISADRLAAIAEFIGTLDADVVALQEVALVSRDGELVDNAGDLARRLGVEVRYAAVRTFEVTDGDRVAGAGLFGNALLSRRPLAQVRAVALPQAPMDAMVEPPGGDPRYAGVRYADAPPGTREPRCLLLATVDGIRVGTAHFSHRGSGERLLQARGSVAAFDGSPGALLLGDLNAQIEAPELAPFSTWTDAFAQPPGDDARISTDDGKRIDHVLGRGIWFRSPARVLRESGDLSDHFPVMAEVVTPD